MRLEFFLGLKYLTGKGRRTRMISFMGLVGVFGVFLGVAVPIIVMSIMLGFQNDMKEKILGVKSHVTIFAPGNYGIQGYRDIVKDIKKIKGVKSAVPYIETQGLVQLPGEHHPVIIRGIHQDAFREDLEFTRIFSNAAGSNNLSRKYFTVIGQEIAKRNYLGIDERIRIITAKNTSLNMASARIIPALVTGHFKTGYYEYDNGVIYLSMETLQDKLDMKDSVSQIELKLDDIWEADRITGQLMYKYGNRFSIYSWKELNANLFKALSLEKIIMWVVVILILVVAIFNIMGTQIMMVMEKRRDIGILKTLGMKPIHIARIFVYEGMIITGIGASTGAILGTLGAKHIRQVLGAVESVINLFSKAKYYIIKIFDSGIPLPQDIHLFPEGVYYIDKIPTDVDPWRAVLMVAFALVLSFIASIMPAIAASFLRPIEVIRYE